jgi:hypothetical protein
LKESNGEKMEERKKNVSTKLTEKTELKKIALK